VFAKTWAEEQAHSKKVNFPNFLNAECNHAETRVLWRTLFSFFWVVCVVGFVLTAILEMF
jgi:hypothetical protein